MAYAVKEIFYSLQGEGLHAGRPSVFLRFAGCNLWTGREEDRTTAVCQFCDTDFVGIDGTFGAKYKTSGELAERVAAMWPAVESASTKYVVCTGGEPLLQLDKALIRALQAHGFEVAVETNGTIIAPEGLDWICMSPKAGATTLLTQGNELKLVFPQEEAQPESFEHLDFDHFFLQPMDGPNLQENTEAALQYCLDHPKWKLSLQQHKFLQIR